MAAGKRGRPRKRPVEDLELEDAIGAAPAVVGGDRPELEDDVLGELEDDAADRYVVAIWRRVEQGAKLGKLEYLARFSTGEFSLDAVRDRFGGGSYEFRVMRKDDHGREKYHRTRSMVLAGAPKHPGENGPALVGSPVSVVPPPASEELRLVREELERARRANASVRRKLEELANRPKASPLEWITALAPIVLPLLKPARPGSDEFVRALELGVKLGGRGGDGDGGALGPIIDKALGVVSTIAQNGRHDASSQTAPQAAIASNGAASAAGGVAQHKLAPLWMQRAAPYFPVLMSWAKAGDDPAARVGFVLEALDEQTRDELGRACEADDFVANALAALPAPFREAYAVTWTTRFLQLVQETLAPEEAAPGEP